MISMKLADPFSAALLLWLTIHAGYSAKALGERVIEIQRASHKPGVTMIDPELKRHRKIVPPTHGKRSMEKFFRTHEFVNGRWQKKQGVKP